MLATFLGPFCKNAEKDQMIFKKLKLKCLQEMRSTESGEQRALFDGIVSFTYAQRETVYCTLVWSQLFFSQHHFILVTSEMANLTLEFANTHTHTHLFCQDYCAHSSSVDPLLPCVCGSSEVNKTSFDQPRSMQRSK